MMNAKTMITATAATADPAMSTLLGVAVGVADGVDVCPLAKAAAERKAVAATGIVSFFIVTKHVFGGFLF
jgi:hypothetical protein